MKFIKKRRSSQKAGSLMKIIKKTIKILDILAWIILLIILPLIMVLGFLQTSTGCSKGPLESIQKCEEDSSTFSFQNSGWWYEDATGDLKREICDEMRGKPKKIAFNTSEGIIELYKVSCHLFGSNEKNLCYASQRMAVNGNSRYVDILINTGECGARYFAGSKMTLIDNKPHAADNYQIPYENIPERPL